MPSWPSIVTTCRCTVRARCWNGRPASRSAAPRWMDGSCEWVSCSRPLRRPSVVSWSAARISKQMKRQWACRCTTDEGKNHQAYLWQYGKPGGNVVFDFRLGRGRDGPKQFLAQFEGILQSDGYAAYEQVGGPKIVHACCWAHARRKFIEALKLRPEDRVATRIVARIDELFSIDAEARSAHLDHAARHALRLQRARPLLDLLKPQIEAIQADALPASALGKAAQYTLALWPKLTRFLDHPELELSNNLAENSMRPLVLGRKNWIHLGSPKVAA